MGMVPFWFFVLGFTSAALAACVYALCVSAKTAQLNAQLLTENDWMRARLADLEDDSVIRVERDSKGRFKAKAGAR